MGLVHDGPFPVVEAGVYPPELWVACKTWGVTPASLLDWAVKRYEVVMVLGSGQKVSVSVKGDWSNLSPIPSPARGGEEEAEMPLGEALERVRAAAKKHVVEEDGAHGPAGAARRRRTRAAK